MAVPVGNRQNYSNEGTEKVAIGGSCPGSRIKGDERAELMCPLYTQQLVCFPLPSVCCSTIYTKKKESLKMEVGWDCFVNSSPSTGWKHQKKIHCSSSVQYIFKFEILNYYQLKNKQTNNLFLLSHRKYEKLLGKVKDDKET